MDFIKNNLFYVILISAILVVSVPSFILASQRQEKIRQAASDADTALSFTERTVKNLKPVTQNALDEAKRFKKEWEAQQARALQVFELSNRHMDLDFLGGQPPKAGETPDPALYKNAYSKAYDELARRLVRPVPLLDPKKSSFSSKAEFGDRTPSPDDISISQKQYWILKELTDVFTDPDCGVKSINAVILDFVPNRDKSQNRPDETSRFWIYPMRLDFRIDFRTFPTFLRKVVENENVMFFIDAFTVARAFDEDKPVYVPLVTVTLYLQAWDYISTPFEQKNLRKYLEAKGKKPAVGRGAAAPAPAARTPAPAPAEEPAAEEGVLE